jgi:tryptophanyl-tRNA synthetase
VVDLQEPTKKMSKSAESPAGTIWLSDPPKVIDQKIKRAVTDSDSGDGSVRWDPDKKPGVAGLLELLALATRRTPQEVAADYRQYGRLKADTAAAVVELLTPIQDRYRELAADPDGVAKVLAAGAERAREVASVTLRRARRAMGLLAR